MNPHDIHSTPHDDFHRLREIGGRRRLEYAIEVGRRGDVADSLALPVQHLLDFGGELRRAYPHLCRLTLFRLNGWGARVAACEHLRGIRELELACWYGDGDAAALAASPHLAALERLELYDGGGERPAIAFACALPNLREIELVSEDGPRPDWVAAVDAAAGRKVATVYDFAEMMTRVPVAADFARADGFFVGKLPDGSQLFLFAPVYAAVAEGQVFEADGRLRGPYSFTFPPEMTIPADEWGDPTKSPPGREDRAAAGRRAYFAARTGFVPAFIRVESPYIRAFDISGPFYDEKDYPIRDWGEGDDPTTPPEQDMRDGIDLPGGFGGYAYRMLRRPETRFLFGDVLWICDRFGEVVFT